MLLFKMLLAVFGFLSLAAADCCDWNGCTPDVRKIYGYDQCPPRNDMRDGYCNMFGGRDQCKGFCQVRTEFNYQGEYPLGGTWGVGWQTYGSSQWMRFGIKWKEPIALPKDVPFSVLEDGISGGLSHASRGLCKVDHVDIELNDGQFGYFTFLPMVKYVCGTYSEAKRKTFNCAGDKVNKGNECAVELSNYGDTTGFWWFANDVGEPTVRGHTVFVYTDSQGYRLPRDQQSDRYKVALDDRVAISDADYAGWQKVWMNPLLADKLEGENYGPRDSRLTCWATIPNFDHIYRDADVLHCSYAVGELMKKPSDLVPLKRKGQSHSFPWERGCQIGVQYNKDPPRDCRITNAEVAAAAGLINFSCMREDNIRNHVRFGVKGSHLVRDQNDPCHAEVWVWGGKGPGTTNIGLVSDDPELAEHYKNMPSDQPNATFGDPYDPDWPEQEWNASHPRWG